MPAPTELSLDQRIARSSESAADLARTMFHENLDFSTASFRELDSIVDHFRRQIPMEFEDSEREEIYWGSILKWGSYFGETMRRTHGGKWIDDGGPVLMIRRFCVHPFHFMDACIRGKTMRVSAHEAGTAVEYYQTLKPVLGEAMGALIRGPEPDEQALAAKVSADPRVAESIVTWLEDALTLAFFESSVILNCAPESLKTVDLLLDEYRLRSKAEPQRVHFRDPQQCLMFGVYLGECMRRCFGGSWINLQTTSGRNIPLLEIRHSFQISPLALLEARLEQGKEGSLWLKFQAIAQRLDHLKS